MSAALLTQPANPLSEQAILRHSHTLRVKTLGQEAGFDLVGVAPVGVFEREGKALQERIDWGLFSGLPWFTKERAAVASDPRSLLPEASSIIALGMSYGEPENRSQGSVRHSTAHDVPAPSPQGVVARYAWGSDYHDVIRARLKELISRLEEELGPFERRLFVDTGRIIDRAAAVRAGLGWYGKNTNVLNSRLGSWFFLAELVTTLDLESDLPTRQNCGACRACIDACPTAAITAPYVLDNNRCIAFLTIEHRGPIPRELRPRMGSYIFGCDICQDVCPVNAQASPVFHREFAPGSRTPTVADLTALLRLDEAAFREHFRGTPLLRPKRRGLLRNVAVALGNANDPSAVPALAEALTDPEPLVRGHAAWALGRLGGEEAKTALRRAGESEADPYVLEEIRLAHPTE